MGGVPMEALLSKKDREGRVERLLDRYLRTERKICTERAAIITNAYKELEGEEIHRKRALVLSRILGPSERDPHSPYDLISRALNRYLRLRMSPCKGFMVRGTDLRTRVLGGHQNGFENQR
jgi:hypothetical protein